MPRRQGNKLLSIRVKRVYDEPGESDGLRILVDRLWPRGIAREKARIDLWLKEIAPSDALRKWFGHDPAKWDAFKSRYFRELEDRPELVAELKEKAQKAPLTLLFAARDPERNNAVALKAYLESKL